MRFNTLLMTAAQASGGTASPPPPSPELFPDPNLDDTDTANWTFNGASIVSAGVADISLQDAGSFGTSASLTPGQSHAAALIAATNLGQNYTVILTISGLSSPGDLVVSLREGSDQTVGIAADGPVTFTAEAGDATSGEAFKITTTGDLLTGTIEAISVKA